MVIANTFFIIARSGVTKQSTSFVYMYYLDCFAPLAMTRRKSLSCKGEAHGGASLLKPPLVRGGGTECRRGFLFRLLSVCYSLIIPTFLRPVFLVVHAADSAVIERSSVLRHTAANSASPHPSAPLEHLPFQERLMAARLF